MKDYRAREMTRLGHATQIRDAYGFVDLLGVPAPARTSDLERLRRGPTRVSGRAMAAALDRVSELTAIGVGQVEIGAVRRRRVIELARYGMAGKAPALRRHPYARRLATLLSTVVVLQARATDDAVELFDVLRMLAHGGNPTQLGEALAHYGRIFKTYTCRLPRRRPARALLVPPPDLAGTRRALRDPDAGDDEP